MREIKYRAWDKDDKKMWKVVTISDSVWGDCEEAHIKICDFDKSPTDKETDVRLSVNFDLMQYTGLKDKNGQEIYEGDIVKGFYFENGNEHRFIGQVKFLGACFKVVGVKRYRGMHQMLDTLYKPIGNIYENPELLEGDSQ